MPGLFVYRSNRLEELADALAEVTGAPLSSPFEEELIVVQSLGMRRWLSLQLADRHGIMMNARAMFPATFIQLICERALGETPLETGFDRKMLHWRIFALLPAIAASPHGTDLAHYMHGEMHELKRFQLARKIADVFDGYFVYRPDLLMEWEAGKESHWQAELWRALVAGREARHAPALARRLVGALQRDVADGVIFPQRTAVFGISSLPPLYVDLLGQIARHVEIHLFQLEPTELYWGDLVSLREQGRIADRHRGATFSAEALHLETGHSLLASMGRVGREFFKLVIDLDRTEETDAFEPPAPETLLGEVQANIFHLRERRTEEKTAIAANDRSLQVHCSHSPTRELEVLHDQLLGMFENDPTLTPKEILVSVPDVEAYAPFIEAVFGAAENAATAIPFTIADRTVRAQSCVADGLLQLLDLAGSRFGVGAVLALLEMRPVQRRFGLVESDLKAIRIWLEQTKIRWGIDAEHRAELGLPRDEQNSWRAGIRRLLLGYALPGDGETLVGDLLPFREIEGDLALILGRFVDFADALFSTVRDFHRARTLTQWEETFRGVLHTFFDESDESSEELRHIRAILHELGAAEETTECGGPIAFEVIRAHLTERLEGEEASAGYMAGRVTFCELKPMRSIPFEVICLLGMNDTAFPRHANALSFDLIARHRRAGDRSLRDDDRHLFLEALLAARQIFYVSYCGASQKDNAESPPSALVSELLDYVETNFVRIGTNPPTAELLTRHPLQPFSPRYFSCDDRLFSYSTENYRASVCGAGQRRNAPGFFTVPLPAPSQEWFSVELRNLAEFFCNPSKFFVRDRLGIRLPSEATEFDEREMLSLEALDESRLKRRLAERGLTLGELSSARAVFRAGAELPGGHLGDAAFAEMCVEIVPFLERLQPLLTDRLLPPLAVNLQIGDWQLSGMIEDVRSEARLCWRAAAVTAADQLRAWVFHLALNCCAPSDYPRATIVAGMDQTFHLAPVSDAENVLRGLLEQYRDGLSSPVPFFLRSSYEFARLTLRPAGEKHEEPRVAARNIWRQREAPESDEAHHRICHPRSAEALDEQWAERALRIFEPLFEHRTP